MLIGSGASLTEYTWDGASTSPQWVGALVDTGWVALAWTPSAGTASTLKARTVRGIKTITGAVTVAAGSTYTQLGAITNAADRPAESCWGIGLAYTTPAVIYFRNDGLVFMYVANWPAGQVGITISYPSASL